MFFAVLLSQLLVLASAPAQATPLACDRDLNAELIESLDADYEKLRHPAPGETFDRHTAESAAKIHELLNRVFYPFLGELHRRVSRTTPEQIAALMNKFEHESPIMEGEYKNEIAQVGSRGHYASQLNVDYNATHERRNFDLTQLGRKTSKFLFVRPRDADFPRVGILASMFGLNITQIGEYGTEFAQDSLRTLQILLELTNEELEGLSATAWKRNTKLLSLETQRGRGIGNENTTPELAPLGAAIEGVMTLHQVMGLLLNEKIPGAETGGEALREIVTNGATPSGLATEFTRRTPVFVTGPATLSGFSFSKPFTRTADGKLAFTERVKSLLKGFMDHKLKVVRREPIICPVASLWMRKSKPDHAFGSEIDPDKVTGIQLLAESYLRIFELVHARRPR